jgi:hypothetical protein
MTRNGKIARLPAAIREELNQRLLEGEQGKPLVAWLNGLPKVKESLGIHLSLLFPPNTGQYRLIPPSKNKKLCCACKVENCAGQLWPIPWTG